jgi:hypothetical protein
MPDGFDAINVDLMREILAMAFAAEDSPAAIGYSSHPPRRNNTVTQFLLDWRFALKRRPRIVFCSA